MADLLFTGFPGFLASSLLPLALRRRPDSRAVCLVQSHHMADARRRLAHLSVKDPDIIERTDLVIGDITEPDLGLGGTGETAGGRETVDLPRIAEVFHLAAVYDVAVHPDVAHRVNVQGTRNVLQLCRSLPGLERLNHVSTCYVAGHHAGVFREDDLDTGQTFTDHYTHTKFEAEGLVREAIAEGLPATIYRPGMVVGDSQTGQTQKFDGPYFLIQFLARQPKPAVMPQVADPDRIRFSLVPRDYVVEAIDILSTMPRAIGRTYALVDPDPPTVRQIAETFARLLDKNIHWVRVPLRFTEALLKLPGMDHLVGFPEEALQGLYLPTVYDTSHAVADLAGTGVTCPPFADYAPKMVEYVQAHPEVTSAAMT